MSHIIKRYTLNSHVTALPMWMQRSDDTYVPRLDAHLAARFDSHDEAAQVAEMLQNELSSNEYGFHHYEVVEVGL